MIPTKEPTRPDPLCPFVHAPFFERANTGRGNLNRVGNLEFNLASFFRPFVPLLSVTYTGIRLSVRGPREKTEAVKIKGTAKESSGNSLVAWSIRSVIENGLFSESVLQRSLLQVYLVCSFSTGREFIVVVSFTDLKRYPFDYPCTQRPPCSANWHTPVAQREIT